MIRKHALPLGAIALYFALIAACHPPPSIQTPQGAAAWKADQVLTRVEELQNLAIEANGQGALSDTDAITVVRWTRTAALTLKAMPGADWRAMLKPGYVEVKARLSAAAKTRLATYLTIFDTVLLGVQ